MSGKSLNFNALAESFDYLSALARFLLLFMTDRFYKGVRNLDTKHFRRHYKGGGENENEEYMEC